MHLYEWGQNESARNQSILFLFFAFRFHSLARSPLYLVHIHLSPPPSASAIRPSVRPEHNLNINPSIIKTSPDSGRGRRGEGERAGGKRDISHPRERERGREGRVMTRTIRALAFGKAFTLLLSLNQDELKIKINKNRFEWIRNK